MKILAVVLFAMAALTIGISSSQPVQALNACNPQVSKC